MQRPGAGVFLLHRRSRGRDDRAQDLVALCGTVGGDGGDERHEREEDVIAEAYSWTGV